ncbi:MAG: hypothetical protein M0P91_08365 [Sulfuricurvum sp.]|jgi:hypothetical protein|uniref:hypothetical protein n=1 Tax=Sulfuricurvum sp. TaxID=2025608 RepID=UPI0025D41FEB|nr:hypothetical protein [Sulfuricurvum sp.]MCK9373198.1 hypothetical protein [Sulfuricurvum sp.]
MIRKHTVALGLSACFILSGCNDKIEEANQMPEKAATEVPAQAPEAPSQAQSVETPAMGGEPQVTPPAEPLKPIEMKSQTKAAPQAAKGTTTVADLFAKKQELNGKSVVIKGNVVKVSDGIMGKSWIHIQDGTGGKETSDIVFTSSTQTATVGDHVTAKGTVAIDKDFGYGYFYSVIVEDATFSH